MRKLYRLYWGCGRMGDVRGLFVADDAKVADAIGKEVYFGEILGKHSEVFGTLEEKDLTVVTDDQDFIERFLRYGCSGSGYNPLEYIEGADDEETDVDEDGEA